MRNQRTNPRNRRYGKVGRENYPRRDRTLNRENLGYGAPNYETQNRNYNRGNYDAGNYGDANQRYPERYPEKPRNRYTEPGNQIYYSPRTGQFSSRQEEYTGRYPYQQNEDSYGRYGTENPYYERGYIENNYFNSPYNPGNTPYNEDFDYDPSIVGGYENEHYRDENWDETPTMNLRRTVRTRQGNYTPYPNRENAEENEDQYLQDPPLMGRNLRFSRRGLSGSVRSIRRDPLYNRRDTRY